MIVIVNVRQEQKEKGFTKQSPTQLPRPSQQSPKIEQQQLQQQSTLLSQDFTHLRHDSFMSVEHSLMPLQQASIFLVRNKFICFEIEIYSLIPSKSLS
jgi:hypothetical protein